MNIKDEFGKAKELSNDIKLSTRNKSIAEKLEALMRMSPAEIFLRDNHISVDQNDSIWDFDSRYSERSPEWTADQNISAMPHYRYDLQKVHVRSFFVIYYVISDRPLVKLGKREFRLQTGDMLIVGPDTWHAVHSLNDTTIVLKYYIRSSTFDKVFFGCMLESEPLADFFKYSLYHRSSANYLIFRTDSDLNIRDIMLSVYSTLLDDKLYANRICEAEMTKLFCCLARDHVENIISNPDSVGGSSIAQTIAYIRKNYATITIEEAAGVAGYSKCYFSQCIHKIFGKTFSELLNDARIDAAAKLISSSQLSLSQIAELVGYKTMTHFYRCFKQIKHCTPMEWRQNTRNQ